MIRRPLVADVESASDLAVRIRTTLSRLKRRMHQHEVRKKLTNAQIAVLFHLEKHEFANLADMARAEGVRSQSMSIIVTHLRDADLVVSSPDPSDGRKTRLALSTKSKVLLREIRASGTDWLTTAVLDNLSAKEQKQLSAALELISRITGNEPLWRGHNYKGSLK